MNIGLVVIVAVVLWSGVAAAQAQRVPCYFIFGDSSADNGNNNQLWSNARANYLPYGIDSSVGPTGRFSNGKTTVDVIAELLGLAGFIRPYASAGARDIFYGVNYASAASGIRDETGQQLGSRISLRGQVQNHIRTAYQMLNSLGDVNRTLTYLGRCIYSIGVGGDDYLNNYFMPQFYPTSRQYTPEQYANLLLQSYAQLLEVLYNYGARKMVLFGISPIGCTPYALAQSSPDGRTCVERLNSATQLFNTGLRSLVDQLNNRIPNARFIYVNVYGIMQNIISNPSSFGVRVTNVGCCRVASNNGQSTCVPLQTPCLNRNEYLYWDASNPTETANTIIARRAYNAQSTSDAFPIDINRLAQI
ncbi:hypothetical protein AAZX31_13G205200 [Glycine max]|uniref:GDSL esterase/lipase n=2 Tax=Glycine subgen. Soja TaxID=1462606 RepID=I1M1M0_SOYBN|nr:GDSL esterase/lipase precursor [Glycine max]XP_028190695.1 GDSL esterase/lipase At1g29670-like isoform X1 [Glycine soja]KAG4977719.1 hypothetical protein JHK86_037193 [Glycine max]KAG5130995.1 hypothetical protein JHK84_037392 [Glycine max]KAH1102798.1 hypothetical protein GYH30_037030 [Glycine max]KHN47367.1 GDSL esterase/lipase [Glycine soja]KRH21145.1 hypothetical protein GLYMA_13G223000v4 [Glycine max]